MNERLQVKDFVAKLVDGKFNTTTNAKGLMTIQQTERNKLRLESVNVFASMLRDYVELHDLKDDVHIYITKAGVVVGVYNVELDQEICFELSPSIPALADNGEPYDAQTESEYYEQDLLAKEKANAEKKAQKELKAKKDAELRQKMKEKKEGK